MILSLSEKIQTYDIEKSEMMVKLDLFKDKQDYELSKSIEVESMRQKVEQANTQMLIERERFN
jgi:hypothetical protein